MSDFNHPSAVDRRTRPKSGAAAVGLAALGPRAASALANAKTSAEVLEARDLAGLAYDAAKRAARLARAMQAMARTQPLRELTGATHAAAWMDELGHLHALREDVGRHNALDKTIGALRHAGLDPARGALLVTSRASYEMVQKAAAAGVGALAAVSAPTALAIRTAQALGLTLVAFARGRRHVVYSHPQRLQAPGLAEGASE